MPIMKNDKNERRNYFIFLLSFIPFFLGSCLKQEEPVVAHTPGNVEITQIEIGYPYINQVYYNCENNVVIRTNTKYDWDLSFECTTNGFHVLLNTAKGVFSCKSSNDFINTHDTAGVMWNWDAPSGNLDSTSFGDWRNSNDVYIIDRQFNATGNHLGYKKIQFISVDDQSYSFKFADLDGSNEIQYSLTKNSNVNYLHFSFNNNGETLTLEPNKDEYDLLFTNHYHKFSNLPLPFVLTQVLTNKHNGVLIAEDNNNNFQNISLKDTVNYSFSNNWDEIGHDWKIRNSQDNSFTIDSDKSFIVKSVNGIYFKIKFIDFYNDAGVKGYPKFEIQQL